MEGKVGFFQVGIIAVAFTWAYFRLPEPAGRDMKSWESCLSERSYERLFKKYQIDTLDINETVLFEESGGIAKMNMITTKNTLEEGVYY